MFVLNLKFDIKKIIKLVIVLCIIISFSFLAYYAYNTYRKITVKSEFTTIDDFIPSNEVAEIKPENFTNILRLVHKDVDTFIGQKISFTGYIYRISNFPENRFILARDMKITENQSVIVGFLSEYDLISEYSDFDWINITATIDKTIYNNETVPLLKIESITKTEEPKNSAVPKPSDDYVETAVIY